MSKEVRKGKRKEKEKKPRGLSTVVGTLLIILITLAAIGIFWVVIKNLIVYNSEEAKAQSEFFSENVRITSFNVNNGLVNISLQKIGGTAKISSQKKTTETTEVITPVDIISAIDLSVSMSICKGISEECCGTISGGWQGNGICMAIPTSSNNACVSDCGGILEDKISAAENANKELVSFILSESPTSRIGLVGYSTGVDYSAGLNLTRDLIQLNDKIDWWNISGGTCTCCGINEAIKKLQESPTDKAKRIIIMSDGEANEECAEQGTGDPVQDAIKAACDANKSLENLIIYTIGVGNNLDEQLLIDIANCGGGKYYPAINVNDLVDVYKHTAEDIKTTYTSTSNLNYLLVVFYNGTGSYTEKIPEIPDVLEMKKYQFDLTGKLEGKITKIEVYPVIITNSGKEITGPPSGIWESKY